MKKTVLAVFVMMVSYLNAEALWQAKGQAPRGRIAGRVLDEAKHPIAEAMLGIVETTAQGEINEMAPMTNEKGLFEWDDLPPGKYKILVNAPGYQKQTQLVEIKAGETTALEIVLKK
jgi:hypothetical protein